MADKLSFKNPPLVEVVAELKWPVQQPSMPGVDNSIPPPIFPVQSGQDDLLYQKFAGKMETLGFLSIERLIPANFPFFAHQVAYRYKKRETDPKGKNYLYQIGPGIFSANALPPYTTWEDFLPVIKSGVKALTSSGINGQFSSLVLRYINAFKDKLIGNAEVMDFMQKTMGFKIGLPDTIIKHAKGPQQIRPVLNLHVPLERGVLKLVAGDGKSAGETAVILDMQVEMTDSIIADAEQTAKRFQQAHDVLREVFMQMTGPIHKIMGKK